MGNTYSAIFNYKSIDIGPNYQIHFIDKPILGPIKEQNTLPYKNFTPLQNILGPIKNENRAHLINKLTPNISAHSIFIYLSLISIIRAPSGGLITKQNSILDINIYPVAHLFRLILGLHSAKLDPPGGCGN